MATAIKTICYPFPSLASISDATVTNFTQISVTLPESSLTFRKVWVEVMCDDITTSAGTIAETRIGLRLGAAGYTTVTNTNSINNSGENMSPAFNADFTSHFTTNWAGESSGGVATCDVQVFLDANSGSQNGFVSGSALLWITYEYDDTSSTQVYTCFIPFNSPTGALDTSKPGSPTDTIPALDTFLGYASISYKACVLVCEGNENRGTSTTDFTLDVEVDTLGSASSGNHEGQLASSRYSRNVFDMMSGGSVVFTTNATHSLYVWSTGLGAFNHLALTLIVTFTFDASSSNAGNRSVLMPMNFRASVYGTTSSESVRASQELWIEEPATITVQKSACRLVWVSGTTFTTGLTFRVGSQSFTAYPDASTSSNWCGGIVLQRTCDDGITLARGRNVLNADVYAPDSAFISGGWGLGALWIVNYKCGKPTGGWGRANRTVLWSLFTRDDTAVFSSSATSATAPTIPESNYFLSSVGSWLQCLPNQGALPGSIAIHAEQLSGEGGVSWREGGYDRLFLFSEVGLFTYFSRYESVFRRFPTDPTATLLDLETNRRYRLMFSGSWWPSLFLTFTYHSISYAVAGDITGSDGGTVEITAHRSDTGEAIGSTSRSGNGAYSMTWYDDTIDVFVQAREDATHVGRSNDGVAS